MQDEVRQKLENRFVRVAEQLNRQMHSGQLDEWEGMDMTIPQIRTLVLLERVDSARMTDIAIYIGRALSATTTVVDRLVERGLVDRVSDPNDRRLVMCELTDTGRQVLERFWLIGRDRLQMVADLLDDEQLGKAVEGLELVSWAGGEILRALAAIQFSE
ncbi:MAG: MarR family transcriptional regulator [Dehalococcoidia bacterium]|nr:MarR family transcriptional regulator [Dehalococcoidia bacterium]MYA62366.1 MarR family transcriptional regulator [Dehalococcoidia bacterium]